MKALRTRLVAQFGNPTGLLGSLAGLIMRIRPSNRERNMRTVSLLGIQPEDRVLEIGFGPGLAVERAAALARRGRVVGIERSELMLRRTAKRTAAAIADGRVELRLASVESPFDCERVYDKVLAVNVYMFWRDPVAVLSRVRATMKPGGTIALTLQPRKRGATRHDTIEAAETIAASLHAAQFDEVRVEMIDMLPVPATCVLANAPAVPLEAGECVSTHRRPFNAVPPPVPSPAGSPGTSSTSR